MAVNKQPILKRCKALGISPMVMGIDKQTKRNQEQGNRRRKLSEYGLQLKEKQKVKFIYGILEKQFRHQFELAQKKSGLVGENLLVSCERRLDNVVFRMGLASTRRESRQLVSHGHFSVNGKRVDIPSFKVSIEDVISLREKSKKSPKFKEITETNRGRVVPLWLDMNKDELSAKVSRLPNRADIDYEVEEQLIVELYSK